MEYLHDSARDGLIRDCIKAVLLRSEGLSTPTIVQTLRLPEISIIRQFNGYFEKNKLKPENGGSNVHLSAAQTEEIVECLIGKTYQCSN